MKKLKKLPPRRSNALSKIFREAFYQKMQTPWVACCRLREIATIKLSSNFSELDEKDILSKDFFSEIFYEDDHQLFWWAIPNYPTRSDPDFEARCLALLLAELIAKEGGL
jgi:hypothetical protein